MAPKDTHVPFPLGEMTLTLQDVALLLGLPCGGEAMGARDIPETWRQDLLDRFALVVRNDHAVEPVVPFSHVHGPTPSWLWQYNVRIPETWCQDLY